MAPGRGYNIFSGMDANQISGMNQSMGLSNMTSLPSPVPVSDAGAGFGLSRPERPQSMLLMSGGAPEEYPDTITVNNQSFNYNDETGLYENAGATYDPETGDVQLSVGGNTYTIQTDETLDPLESAAPDATTEEEEEKSEQEKILESVQEDIFGSSVGYSEDEMSQATASIQSGYSDAKQSLDEKYAFGLESALAGIDRQMAMMGTFGSGSHMMNLNNATAQVLSNMAAEYAALEKDLADRLLDLDAKNLQQMKTDLQQIVQNKFSLADRLANLPDADDDFYEKQTYVNDTIDVITSEVAALSSDGGLGMFSPALTKAIENKYEKLMMDAESPEEIQALKEELEDFLVSYMAAIKVYTDKANTTGDKYTIDGGFFGPDTQDTQAKQEAAMAVANAFAPLFYEMGLIDAPTGEALQDSEYNIVI